MRAIIEFVLFLVVTAAIIGAGYMLWNQRAQLQEKDQEINQITSRYSKALTDLGNVRLDLEVRTRTVEAQRQRIVDDQAKLRDLDGKFQFIGTMLNDCQKRTRMPNPPSQPSSSPDWTDLLGLLPLLLP